MNAETPTPDLAACEAFAAFWCRLTGAPHITLTTITPDGPTTTATFARGQAAALRGFIADAQRDGRNVHFHPNETPSGCTRKASKKDMVAVLCRHADVDPMDDRFPLAEERDRLHRLAEALAADAVMPPTVIINSGSGLQPLWVVAREPLTPEALARAEMENKAVEGALGAAGTHDVSRLLRLPGTVNFPNKTKLARGRGITRARVVFQADRAYGPADAARLGGHLVGLLAGKGVLRGKEDGTAVGGADDADPVLARLHRAIRSNGALAVRWAGDTVGLKDSSRSCLALALCGLLRRAGIGREDTFHLLRRHPVVGSWCTEKGDLDGGRELHRLWERAGEGADAAGDAPWPPPQWELATADALPPPRLDLGIFPDPWPRWIARAAEGAGAPPDFVAGALLAVAGATIGNARWGSPWEGWRHPPVVNIACIGLPSAGKSPAINAVAEPLAALAADLNDDFEERMREYRTAKQEAKERRALWETDVKAAVKAGRPPPAEPPGAAEPELPRKRRASSTDPTVEAARDLSAANPRGLGLHRDELAGWIGGMDRYGGGKGGAERAFWLQAYEGGRWSADRVKDGDEGRDVPHLTWGIVGGIQPDRLAAMLLSGADDGLSARFLYTWPAPPVDVSDPPDGAGLPFALKPMLRRLRELPMPDEPEPVVLPFTPEARDALQEWRREVKRMEHDAAGLFLSWLGKLPGMAVRLAVVFLHLEWLGRPAGTPSPEAVNLDALARALGFLADYAVPMARRAFGEAALPEAERDARRLARWLRRQSPIPETLNARALRRQADGPGIATPERIEAALGELKHLGLVDPAPAREGGGKGRQRADWAVNPALREGAP